MDIRSFFNRTNPQPAAENQSRIKKAVKTPEKQTSKPVSNKESKSKKSCAKQIEPDVSSSDAENPIPSKLSKVIHSDELKKKKSPPHNKAQNGSSKKQPRKRVQIESDSEDSIEHIDVSKPVKFTKLHNTPPKKSKVAKETKTTLKKKQEPILPVVDIESSSDIEVEEKRTSKPQKKTLQKVPLEVSHGKKSPVKRKTNATAEPVQAKKMKHEPVQKAAQNEKLNPISVADFFNSGTTKVKSKNAKQPQLENHEDQHFNETLLQAEDDLVTPQTKKPSPEKQNGSVKKKHVQIVELKTPEKSPSPQKVQPSRSKEKSARIKPVTPEDRSKSQRTPKPSPIKENDKNIEEDAADNDFKTISKRVTPRKASATKEIKDPVRVPKEAASVAKIEIKESGLLVDKYKPKSVKQILGQQGDKSCANKLLNWLRNWNQWHVTKTKEKKKGFGANDDGSCFKCALLSGSPGIGKTTTAELCCKELGIKYIAKNASDVRSKKTLETQLMESISSHSMNEYTPTSSSENVNSSGGSNKNMAQHALIMDEVDGMAGNEDRSGIAELIAFVKSTKIPLICICNDRQAQKIRSLSNHCFDLRFHQPQVSQIKGPMMSIAFKENVKISGSEMEQIIEASGHDVRQILYRLSLLAVNTNNIDNTKLIDQANNVLLTKKDTAANIFETVRTVFADNATQQSKTWNEKCELFFSDYNLMPLFTFENYLNVESKSVKKMSDKLELLADASDLMATGDTMEKMIRSQGNWSLLNDQAIFSVVAPAERVKGYLKGMTQFPQWFGKNSKQTKNCRLLSQLQMHTSLKTSCNPCSFNLDYAPVLRLKILNLLLRNQTGGVEGVVDLLSQYDLTKEDMDNVLDLTLYPNSRDTMAKVAPKTKAALTRAYNKQKQSLPFTTDSAIVNKKNKKTGGKNVKAVKNGLLDKDVDDEGESGEDDQETDAQVVIDDFND